jgi:hypothetical protein
MQTLLEAYIEALFWAELDDHDEPLDKNYKPSDLDPESREGIERDCAHFEEQARPILETLDVPAASVGHDFLLTRNRHGAGFWDSPEKYGGQERANQLTAIAHEIGEIYAYVGDDGKVYVSEV